MSRCCGRRVAPGGTWADIGAGEGAFTLALADLLGPGGRIVAVDRDATGAARRTTRAVRARFPETRADDAIAADLTAPARPARARRPRRGEQPPLRRSATGRSRSSRRWPSHLRPGGRFVVVEYDADRGNPWVPHPFSYRVVGAARRGGRASRDTRRIGRVPSRFLGRDLLGGEPPTLAVGRPSPAARPRPSRPSQNAPRRSGRGRCTPAPAHRTSRRPSPRARRCPWTDDDRPRNHPSQQHDPRRITWNGMTCRRCRHP